MQHLKTTQRTFNCITKFANQASNKQIKCVYTDTKRECKNKSFNLVAFVFLDKDKTPALYLRTKCLPNKTYVWKAVILHEVGHLKTGLGFKPYYLSEFKAHEWALREAKRLHLHMAWKRLMIDLILWGISKRSKKQYQKASQMAHEKGYINRKILNKLFKGSKKNLDNMFKEYCKRVKKI